MGATGSREMNNRLVLVVGSFDHVNHLQHVNHESHMWILVRNELRKL